MRSRAPMTLIAVVLLTGSVVVYYAQVLIYRDPSHTGFYFLQDLAFVPIQVLLVVLLIERMLAERDRRALLHKLNMVIGAFFSEVGTRLLGELTPAVRGKDEIRERLGVSAAWTHRDFQRAMAFAREFAYDMDPRRLDLYALRDLLAAKREFMVRLLENPNLLEHERFTDMLWAIFHLSEELSARESLLDLSDNDRAHLADDMERAYSRLTGEWVAYLQHLQASYPFLFSLVARTHPLQEHPSAAIP